MESKPRTSAAGEREYEEFEPSVELELEAAADTLLIYLPGFRKEQLKVQVTSTGNLRISGERQVSGNKWSRFHEEMPISTNYDPNEITAKFENGTLFVKLPKIIVPATPQREKKLPPAEAPKPRNSTEEKAQPPAQVPKLDQKAPQEKAVSPAEAAKGTSTVQERVQPPAVASKPEKPSQEKDKPLGGEPKPVKPRRELEDQGPDPKVGVDKQKSGESANAAPEKAKMEDREGSQYERKEQSNGRLKEEKVNAAASTSAKDEKPEDWVHEIAKLATGIVPGNGKFKAGNYRQVLTELTMELKKPRKLIKLVLAILSVVVFALYAMDAIRSLRRPEN